MARRILFLQGGGEGARDADALMMTELSRSLAVPHIRFPAMPEEADPDYLRWKPVIERELDALNETAVVIAHSLGASFLLKALSDAAIRKPLGALFLLATPYWGGAGWRYEGFEQVALSPNYAEALPRAPIHFYHCRDDAIVPFQHLALYAADLPGAGVHAFDTGGHQFNDRIGEVAADLQTPARRP
jgi:predicted alpha/beta hydrolase family esterase